MSVDVPPCFQAGMATYPEEARSQWVLEQPAQLVIAVSQVYWCAGVEACFAAEDVSVALAAYMEVCCKADAVTPECTSTNVLRLSLCAGLSNHVSTAIVLAYFKQQHSY